MLEHGFKEKDKERYVEALNYIATHAKFGDSPPSVKEAIEIRNHFAFLQEMAVKIDSYILDNVKVHEPKSNDSEES